MKLKVLAFVFTLIAFGINLYADEYKFDYAVIDNEKVTTVSASNITAHLISKFKTTVTYKNETVTLTLKDSFAQTGNVLWFKAYEHQWYHDDGSGWSQWYPCKHNITFDTQKEVITLHTMNKVTCMIMDWCGKEIVQEGELYEFYCRFNDDEKYGYVRILFALNGQHRIYFNFSSANKHVYKVKLLE